MIRMTAPQFLQSATGKIIGEVIRPGAPSSML
jgi:hypothetical protein